MNQNRHIDGHAEGDDRTLGADLGATIGRRSESLDRIPPVGGVVERAAAAASARRLRYTLVGVTAAAALLAGGLVAWSTLGDSGEAGNAHVATGPTAPGLAELVAADGDTGDGSGPASAQPAAPTEEDGTSAGPKPADPPAAGPKPADPPAADPADAAADPASGSAEPDSSFPTPEELSTGPTLTWTAVSVNASPGIVDIYGLESVGDGRITAWAWGEAGDQIVMTDDGTTWTTVPTPAGIAPGHIDIAGSRWVVVGVDLAASELTDRVYFSDDEGVTWTELVLEIAPDPEPRPSYCVEHSRVQLVMASGTRIVVVEDSYIDVDLQGLLIERGFAPDRESILNIHHTDRALILRLGDGSSTERLTIAYEELGLAPGQPQLCASQDGTYNERVRIYTNGASGAELVAEYRGWGMSAISTEEGFSVVVDRNGSALLLTSSDGRTWTERATALGGFIPAARGPDGAVWRVNAYDTYRIQHSSVDDDPRTVASFDALQPGEVLAAGPAGVVVTAWARPDNRLGLVPDARITKDGYELRLGQPVGGMTLWDLTEDVAVYEFGTEDFQSDTPPEGVRGITEEDGSVTIVFEDPDTGEDLVSFAADDLAPDMEQLMLASGRFDAFEQPPSWIGWSGDGESWGWQDAADAFGIDPADGDPWVDLAVGDDFVIARVAFFRTVDVFSDSAELQPYPPLDASALWFIAPVP